MSAAKRALVIGAGIGGLATAIALGQHGWTVTVIERRELNTTVGVGLNHPSNALRALRSLGLLEQVKEYGYHYRGIKRFDLDGNQIALFQPQDPEDVPFQISMPRADLHRILSEAADAAGAHVRFSTRWTGFEQKADGVEVALSDGSTDSYDIVVAADGLRSSMRQALFGDGHDPIHTGFGAWRVAVPKPPDRVFSEYWQGAQGKATIIHLNDDLMYLLFVDRPEAGWTFDPSRAVEDLRDRLEGFTGIIGEIRDSELAREDIHWGPLEEVVLEPSWFAGRIVLIGDAAHAVTPHLAQGAGLAMEDALVLADELDRNGSVPTALTAFMQRRYPRVKFVQDHAHEILVNEMQTDEALKVKFAEGLGARQAEIARTLTSPA